jgi:hypothetical protein
VIPRRRPGRRLAAAALLVALAAGACGPTAVQTAAPTATPVALTTPGLSPSGAATRPGPSATAVASGAVRIDPSLLDLLPADVAGHTFEPSPEAAAEAATDPGLAVHAESIAVAIAADPSTDSIVVASVAGLLPGAFDEEFFRDWRDSFDEGVCSRAGGVSGNAQADIAGRTVYIGTCAGGVHTYHVHLEEPNAIVSLNVVGDTTLGQQVLETLRD